jgi:hypothetical protein
VYSEIRERIDARSALGLHVLQHLEGYVATNTFLKDGQVFEYRRFGWVEEVRGLYVHPVSGLLRYLKAGRGGRRRG